MENEQQSSVIVRLSSVAFFLVFAVAALTWFAISITRFITQFTLNGPVVEFDKGSMYMLGGGLCCLLITAGGIIQGLLEKKLTSKLESLFTRGIIGSLILMFGFPILTHHAVAYYAQQRNYSVCSDATYRWLLYSKFYYAKTDMGCNELVVNKEINRVRKSF